MATAQWYRRADGASVPVSWGRLSDGVPTPTAWNLGAPVLTSSSLPDDVVAAGYTSLAFIDDFDSAASIDMAGAGAAGYKWYRRMPFDPAPNNDTPTSAITVANSVVTLNQTFENWNQGLYTVHRQTRNGRGFRYGYFEARMRFDPSKATSSNGFPAFWLLGLDHVLGDDDTRWGELDIFEAFHYQATNWNGQYVGTVHDWTAGSPNIDRSNTGSHMSNPLGANFTEWHTYSVLWTPGRVRWYFDGVQVLEQNYGTGVPSPNVNNNPAGTFSVFDSKATGMAMILGTGVGYPLDVDWVKVWQAPTSGAPALTFDAAFPTAGVMGSYSDPNPNNLVTGGTSVDSTDPALDVWLVTDPVTPSRVVACCDSRNLKTTGNANPRASMTTGEMLPLGEEYWQVFSWRYAGKIASDDWNALWTGGFGPPYDGPSPLSLALQPTATAGMNLLRFSRTAANGGVNWSGVEIPVGPGWVQIIAHFKLADAGWLEMWLNTGPGPNDFVKVVPLQNVDMLAPGSNGPQYSSIGVYGVHPKRILFGVHQIATGPNGKLALTPDDFGAGFNPALLP